MCNGRVWLTRKLSHATPDFMKPESSTNTADANRVGSTGGSALHCRERINDYLSAGGLFNPELMEHEKVRELLLDCREEIMELQLARDRYHTDRDIWKWRAEKAEAAWLCDEHEARRALEDIVRGDYADGAERAHPAVALAKRALGLLPNKVM